MAYSQTFQRFECSGSGHARCDCLPAPKLTLPLRGAQSDRAVVLDSTLFCRANPSSFCSCLWGHDGNFTAGAAGVLIPCLYSSAASHRGAAGVLGPRNFNLESRRGGGVSPSLRPLRSRSFLCHFWIRDGLLLRTSVRTARRSDQVLR